jgi:hypothetical protein
MLDDNALHAVAAAAGRSNVAGAGPRRLTSSVRDTSPRRAPGGKRLAFVRSAATQSSGGDGGGGRPHPGQISMLPIDGGEAWSTRSSGI